MSSGKVAGIRTGRKRVVEKAPRAPGQAAYALQTASDSSRLRSDVPQSLSGPEIDSD